jgi:coiled-coil domain-containing protein 40
MDNANDNDNINDDDLIMENEENVPNSIVPVTQQNNLDFLDNDQNDNRNDLDLENNDNESDRQNVTSSESNNLVVLDPDHPLMKRFQIALNKQLTKRQEKLMLEMRETKYELEVIKILKCSLK